MFPSLCNSISFITVSRWKIPSIVNLHSATDRDSLNARKVRKGRCSEDRALISWRAQGCPRSSPSTNPRFCDYCSEIREMILYMWYPEVFFTEEGGIETYSRKETKSRTSFKSWPNYLSFKQSTADEYHICNIFLSQIEHDKQGFLENHGAVPSEITIELKHALNEEHGLELSCQIFAKTRSSSASNEMDSVRSFTRDANSRPMKQMAYLKTAELS